MTSLEVLEEWRETRTGEREIHLYFSGGTSTSADGYVFGFNPRHLKPEAVQAFLKEQGYEVDISDSDTDCEVCSALDYAERRP